MEQKQNSSPFWPSLAGFTFGATNPGTTTAQGNGLFGHSGCCVTRERREWRNGMRCRGGVRCFCGCLLEALKYSVCACVGPCMCAR